MKIKLICQDPLASPRELVVERFPLAIGRGSDASLRIDDRWISRRHCELSEDASGVLLRDLGSRHGTYVNGHPVQEARLSPGDEICVGLSHFVVEFQIARTDLPRSTAAVAV